MRRGLRRPGRLVAVAIGLFALLGLGLAFAPAASAHATVVGSTPVDGSRLSAAPSSVTIDFDEAVTIGGRIGYLHVVDQAGRRVDTGATTHPGGDASKITVALRGGLGDSTYTASFRIVSADSHPVAGAVRFLVGNGSFAAVSSSGPSATNGVTSKTYDVIRWVSFAGLALLGGAWLMFSVWPAGRDDRRARRLVWSGWGLTVFGSVAELLVQGPYAAGSGLGTIGQWALLDATLHTTFGLAHTLRLIALGVVAVVLSSLLRTIWRSRGHLEEVGALLVLGVALSFAASGHAASEHPEWLAVTSDTVHLIAMTAWIGGLAYLLVAVLPRRESEELGYALPVFSVVAYASVAALAITGTYQAWLGVGSWRALVLTTYGQLVLVKIGLFLALLGLGNASRLAVQRRWGSVSRRVPVAYAMTDEFDDPDPDAEFEPVIEAGPEFTRLRRVVLVEVALAAVVLGVTGVLVAQPPGAAALISIDSRPQTMHAALGNGRTATITLSSARHGELSVDVTLSSGPAPQSISATAALPAKQLGPVAIPLKASGRSYSASAVLFPAAGRWVITLTVRTSQFDSTVAAVKVSLH
ncbi:MAG: copper resistance protein CopC/CopD [Actinobacteria bacterium]|nr:copper resistance protein CopC/CopD [Actinomycetota bacterium]